MVFDKDFDAPLPGATVAVVETEASTTTTDQGNFVLADLAPGTYTVVVSKPGYVRQVRTDVVVAAGQLSELTFELAGDFTEMDEFIVQDVLAMGAGSEAALLQLRLDSPSFMDSISADLMSRAGASDAASALRLVAGASVQDGKFAVIRGLPDRYVNSQINGVRLPSADEDTRAVELDQFPAAVIESIQVSKTFTPDQQGDASGGAVNVRLKGIPDEPFLLFKGERSFNSQVMDADGDFLSYKGGGLDYWGDPKSDKDTQPIGTDWRGAVGVSEGNAPTDGKWSVSTGNRWEYDDVTFGGFLNFFHEEDSSYFDNGEDNSLWQTTPGGPLVPQTFQGAPSPGGVGDDFKTGLFDVTEGAELVQWGGLGTLGMETENHSLTATYLYSRTSEDKATLAEDTRGKAYFFPGYDPDDPMSPGNLSTNVLAAPYLRTETLEYTERTTSTFQLTGTHVLPELSDALGFLEPMGFLDPEIDWTFASSSAELDQPDKVQFGSLSLSDSFNPGFPPFIDPFVEPAVQLPFKPAANFNLGNVQHIDKNIQEDGDQFSFNLKLPFEQWGGHEGYVKLGTFHDDVDRKYREETFSNTGDGGASFEAPFNEFWSKVFPLEGGHEIFPALTDVDYDGEQELDAWFGMVDLPLTEKLTFIGGARVERTKIGITNDAEEEATWFPPGEFTPTLLGPGDADVSIDQRDVLPALALVYNPVEAVTLRASYSETVARPTFKELTPILQEEFLGGPIFIGNPGLELSSLDNYDLRVDYRPYEGSLLSASYFKKDITDAIENVQRIIGFSFTTPVNFPKGEISGYELEARQDLGLLWEPLDGFSVGANATFINSNVELPDDEAALFDPVGAPQNSRDATNAPEHLYNLNLNYDRPDWGTSATLFYSVRGDTLVSGATVDDNNFVPDIYAKEFGTLNFSLSQQLSERSTLTFKAKNLTNPRIEEVYRSDYINGEPTHTSFTRGREYSLSLSVRF